MKSNWLNVKHLSLLVLATSSLAISGCQKKADEVSSQDSSVEVLETEEGAVDEAAQDPMAEPAPGDTLVDPAAEPSMDEEESSDEPEMDADK